MKIIITNNSHSVAEIACDNVVAQLKAKPFSVLGLATGSTPITLYEKLIERHKKGEVHFKEVHTFNLDEYIGLEETHPQSYRFFMDRYLFNHIDIQRDNIHFPEVMSDVLSAAKDYEAILSDVNGIDLQILGIGQNGHIGFNEPYSSLGSRTRVKTLTRNTVEANRRFFDEDEYQPHLAITMGLGTIMDARHVVLLATGESKAPAIRDMVEGALTASCPASVLQMHAKVTVVIDEAAAALLSDRDYFDWAHKEQLRLE